MPLTAKRIICFFVSLMIILSGVAICSVICNHPSEDIENTVSSFYREPENSLDVVFVGSSGASKDFLPSAVWKKTGITSYCFALGACSANIYYSVIKEVLTKQPDALLVIDLDGFLVDDKFQNEKEPIMLWTDSMPKNRNWREVVNRFLPDEKSERYFEFIKYHKNISTVYAYLPMTYRLLNKQINNIRDPLGGATLNRTAQSFADEVKFFDYKAENESQSLTPDSNAVFEDFLVFCEENNLKNIVFVNLPKITHDEFSYNRAVDYYQRTNYIKSKVEKYGYKIYNYSETGNEANLDIETDFADTLHLTTPGAVKFSEAFADYLERNYSFEKKSPEIIRDWNERSSLADEIIYE